MNENIAKKTFSRIGFAQVAGLAASILIGTLVLAPLVAGDKLQEVFAAVGPSVVLLMIYVPQIANLIVYWLCVRTMPKPEWQREPVSFKTLVQIFLMMYAISSVINQIGLAITKTAPAGGNSQLDLLAKMQSTKLPVAIAIPVVIGPILEELIFRKLMLDRTKHYGEKTAIIFSALCFGLFHGNLTQFLYASVVELFLGYVYCKTGKVLYTMIMHMLLNGTSTVILLLLPLFEQEDTSGAAISLIVLLLVLLVLGVMTIVGFIQFFLWIKRKKFVFDESMPDFIPQNEVLKTVYLNPGVILLFIVQAVGIIADLFNIDLHF